MKKIIIVLALGFSLAGLCFAQAADVNRGFFYQEGIASWYGREFNGRPTASGEIFNDSLLTAAHPILPFGTILKITNQYNNKSVTVRVNDRGPFVSDRILDMSRAAAEQLDMIAAGTAPIKIESLSEVSLPVKTTQSTPVQSAPVQAVPGSALPVQNGQTIQVRPASAEPFSGSQASQPLAVTGSVPLVTTGAVKFNPAIPQYITGKKYKVQVGAYRQSEHAIEAYEKLKNAGLSPSYERYGDYCRVVLPGLRQEDLRVVSDRLAAAGFKEVLLREE